MKISEYLLDILTMKIIRNFYSLDFDHNFKLPGYNMTCIAKFLSLTILLQEFYEQGSTLTY